MNPKQARAKREGLCTELRAMFAHDASGAVDYDATAWSNAKTREWRALMAKFPECEKVIDDAEDIKRIHESIA